MQDFKYDKIGIGYNSTRQADPFLASRLLYHLRPRQDKLYLDIGCGTGNYTCALADKGLQFIGVEPSDRMLNVAKQRDQNIKWLKGTVEKIPVEDKFFDGIIATLTMHHWTDLDSAFIELDRVLVDYGKIVVFTSTPEQMKGYWLNHYFPKMLQSSILQMPSLATISKSILNTGLVINDIEKYSIKDDLKDSFLYVGKNEPDRYFDESIRLGISSFSSLANIEEVNEGLLKLKKDIDDQIFEKIKSKYENEIGDYMFIVIDKKSNALL